MTVDRTGASLRCFTREASAAFVGEALQCAPSSIFAVGEPVHARRPSGALRDASLWILESPLDGTVPLEEHLEHLLAVVERRADAFDAVRARLEHVELFCFVSSGSQGSLEFAPELLARLAARGLALSLDLYASGAE